MKGRSKSLLTNEDKEYMINKLLSELSNIQNYRFAYSGSDSVKRITEVTVDNSQRKKLVGISVGELEEPYLQSKEKLEKLDALYEILGQQEGQGGNKAVLRYSSSIEEQAGNIGLEDRNIGDVTLDPRVSKATMATLGFDDSTLKKLNYRQVLIIYDLMFDISAEKFGKQGPQHQTEAMKFILTTISKALQGTELGMKNAGDFTANQEFLSNLADSLKLVTSPDPMPAKAASAPAKLKSFSSSVLGIFKKDKHRKEPELNENQKEVRRLKEELERLSGIITNDKTTQEDRTKATKERGEVQSQIIALNLESMREQKKGSQSEKSSPRKK